MKKNLWTGLTAVFVFLLCFAIIGNSTALYYSGTINGILGISTTEVVEIEGDTQGSTVSYESAYGELTRENLDRLIADTYQQCIDEGNEGMVLLKNQSSALPLSL